MTKKYKHYGLVGYPLSHSFSPSYFRQFFLDQKIDWASYELFPVQDLSEITSLLQNVDGVNVTIPYKQEIIPYLDNISKEAEEIKAVNCIKVSNGKTTGYNTDIYGFKNSLMGFISGTDIKNALILGDGGAAKAVKHVLKQINIPFTIVSRTRGDLSYEELTANTISNCRLIINTTPLGMYPDVEKQPKIPYNAINESHFLFDLVYNPEKTLFLNSGLAKGAKVKSGYEMLILQAQKSWDIWTNNQIQ
jgi:shikimate dehydrogenase